MPKIILPPYMNLFRAHYIDSCYNNDYNTFITNTRHDTLFHRYRESEKAGITYGHKAITPC